uniref:hypothetical protein n=1 Tax=Emticicia oligotrophica TaxID=312279 RepID=UPI00273AD173
VKLCETEKIWQKYHSEDLSKTNVANNKPDLANPSAASSQKNMRLKSEFGSSNETLSQKLSNYFSDI